MSIKKMKKEDLELLSYKDIAYLLIEENGAENTANLFKKIVDLLELSPSSYESKIGDFYMMLTTDKRFILLDDGNWDLRNKYTSDKVIKEEVEDEDESNSDDINSLIKEEEPDEYELDKDKDDYDDTDDDYKDLVIVDEEDLDLE